MTRRLQLAGIGLCAFLLPACSTSRGPTDPYYPGAQAGYVMPSRPGANQAGYRQPAADAPPINGAPLASDLKLGPPAPVDLAPRPDLKEAAPKQPNQITITELPPQYDSKIAVESPLSDMAKPTVAVAAVADSGVRESGSRGTALPNEPVKFPDWPLIDGMKVSESILSAEPVLKKPEPITPATSADAPLLKKPEPATNADQFVLKKSEPANNAAPSAGVLLPPNVPMVLPPIEEIKPAVLPTDNDRVEKGVSLKIPDPIDETSTAVRSPIASDHNSSHNETILIQAIKAFQNKRPEEAVERLKHLEPANQEILMNLMPLIVRLGDGNVSTMQPEETAILIDRLQTAASMLKSKASLGAEHVCFCRGVRKFADVDPYDPRHEFRPGDMVFLYAELKNFTCEALPAVRVVNGPATPSKGFAIRLGATLELRDARYSLVWRTDLNKNDYALTPPQDYYHTYRFCVPDKLPAGTYTLWLNIIDKPTGRTFRKPVEMRVGQS